MQKVYRMLLLGVLVGLLSNCQAQQPIPTVVSQTSPTMPPAVAQVSPPQPSLTPTPPPLRMPTNERVLVQVNQLGVVLDQQYAWLTATASLTPLRFHEPELLLAIPNTSMMICRQAETVCLFDLDHDQIIWELQITEDSGPLLVALDHDAQGVYLAFNQFKDEYSLLVDIHWWHVRLSDGTIVEQARLDNPAKLDPRWLTATGDLWFQAQNGLQLWHYAPRDQNLTLASIEGFAALSEQRLFVLTNPQTLVELNAVDGLPLRIIKLAPPLAQVTNDIIVTPNLDQVAFGDMGKHWQIYDLETGGLLEEYHLDQAYELLPSYQLGYWYASSNAAKLIKLWQPAEQRQTDLRVLQYYGDSVSHLWLWPEQPIPTKPVTIVHSTPMTHIVPTESEQLALFAAWSDLPHTHFTVWGNQQVELLEQVKFLINRPGLPDLVLYRREHPIPRLGELWLYDPQTRIHSHLAQFEEIYRNSSISQMVINPSAQQVLIGVEPDKGGFKLFRLDLATNQLLEVESRLIMRDLLGIKLLAWNQATAYAFLSMNPNDPLNGKPVLAKLTLNQQAKIEILAELSDWPQTWVSANQQTLVYRQSQTASEQTLVWWNLTNQTSSTLRLPLVAHDALALAPDGSALAIVTFDSAQHMGQLKLYDHASKTWKVLDQQSSGHNVTTNPTLGWSADGVRLWWQRNLQQPLLTKEYRVYTATGAFQWADPLPLHNHSVVSADAETVVLVGVAGTMLQERKHGQITAQFGLPADLLEQRALAGVNR